jgi:hypothetical protein
MRAAFIRFSFGSGTVPVARLLTKTCGIRAFPLSAVTRWDLVRGIISQIDHPRLGCQPLIMVPAIDNDLLHHLGGKADRIGLHM